MLKYFLKRIGISLLVLLGVTFLVFFMANQMEGNPATMMITPEMTQEQVAELERSMGLDQPIITRYFAWLQNFLRGNFGISYNFKISVNKLIAERLRPTLILTVSSCLIAILIAVPAGTIAAYKPYSLFDYSLSGVSFLGAAAPDFFIALVAIYFLGLKLNILPTSGMHAAGDESLSSYVRYAIMPVLVLSFRLLGSLTRQTRSAVLEVMSEDFIRTDRALGYSEPQVVMHALRNALIPIVTNIGGMIPFCIGGSVVLENVFGWPGIGKLLVNSVTNRDYPVIVAVSTLIAVAVLGSNILVDFIFTLLDPRITHTQKCR